MATIYRNKGLWRAQVRAHGKSLSKTFDTKREAQVWARDIEVELDKAPSSDPAATFREILAVYRGHARPGGRTKQACLAKLEAYWGDWRVADITSAAVAAFARTRRLDDGCAPSTVLMDLTYLSTVLGNGGVLAGNRNAQIAKLELSVAIKALRHAGTVGDSEERARRPTDEELTRLFQRWASSNRLRTPMIDLALFAIATCMRMGEIAGPGGIVWQDLDREQRTIWVRKRKDPRSPNGRDDLVPLLVGHVTIAGRPVDPLEIIQRQPTAWLREGRIFPYAENTVGIAWATTCDELGIADLTFHDLRHDAISRMFEAGFDIPQVAAVSGHRSWKNLKRYAHIRPASIHQRSIENAMVILR